MMCASHGSRGACIPAMRRWLDAMAHMHPLQARRGRLLPEARPKGADTASVPARTLQPAIRTLPVAETDFLTDAWKVAATSTSPVVTRSSTLGADATSLSDRVSSSLYITLQAPPGSHRKPTSLIEPPPASFSGVEDNWRTCRWAVMRALALHCGYATSVCIALHSGWHAHTEAHDARPCVLRHLHIPAAGRSNSGSDNLEHNTASVDCQQRACEGFQGAIHICMQHERQRGLQDSASSAPSASS